MERGWGEVKMKQLFLFTFLLLSATTFAQTDAQLKKAKAAMSQAQQQMNKAKNDPAYKKAMDEYKKQMPIAQQKMDSIKATKDGASIKDIEMPDIDKLTKLPDLNKITTTMEESKEKLASMKKVISEGNKKGLPQKSNTPFTANSCSQADIEKWANTMLANAIQKSTVGLLPMLKATYNDTTQNAASVGMIMIATGQPKYTGQYLVCRYILDHPNNAMAINDLGIFYRLENDYKKAIPLFLTAQQLNDTCIEIKTNLAWAYAYAGDFGKAKQYFNIILNLNPSYSSAMEGLALIAYQEGDKQALWNSLSKQLLSSNKSLGFSGSFPSAAMASFCGGVLNEDELNNVKKDGNNATQNNYGENTPPNSENQSDEKMIATEPDISYYNYVNDFPNDPQKIDAKQCAEAIDAYGKAIRNIVNYVKSLLPTLPKPMTFINSYGEQETIYDYNNDAHYILFGQMHQQFQKQRAKIYDRTNEKLTASTQSFSTTYYGVIQAYTKALKRCDEDDSCKADGDCECIRKVKCEYMPKLSGTIKSFAMSIGDIVTTGLNEMQDKVDIYRNNTAPLIQYISEPNWNKYINAVKEADVRQAKLMMMMSYQNFLPTVRIMVEQAKGLSVEGECVFEARIPPLDITTPRLRNLKTLAPPCSNDNNHPLHFNGQQAASANPGTAYKVGKLSYEDNCNHTRIAIDVASVGKSVNAGTVNASAEATGKAYFELIKSKYVGEDKYTAGIELTAKVQVGINTKREGEFEVINPKVTGSAKAQFQVTLDISRSWNAQGQPIQKSVKWNANGSVSGSAGINAALSNYTKANKDFFSQSFTRGFETNGEFAAVVGADGQLGNYNLQSFGGKTIKQ